MSGVGSHDWSHARVLALPRDACSRLLIEGYLMWLSKMCVARYVGTFGTEKLREELKAENEGVKIPFAVRRLGRPSDVKAVSRKEQSIS